MLIPSRIFFLLVTAVLFPSQVWSQALKTPAFFLFGSRLKAFMLVVLLVTHHTVFKRAISVVCICVFMYLLKKKGVPCKVANTF